MIALNTFYIPTILSTEKIIVNQNSEGFHKLQQVLVETPNQKLGELFSDEL